MKAGALVVGLVLMVVLPAQAQHGGGGHSGGFGGGHFGGGHFGGHHGKSGLWGPSRGGHFSGATVSHVAGPPRLTSFVGFASTPNFQLFFNTDHFFCPLHPHRVFPFCRFCILGAFGGFGFSDFGFFPDFGTAIPVQLPAGASPSRLPALVFTNGWSFEVADYWVDDDGALRYVTTYGGLNVADLQSLDLYATVQANAERGIPFTLKLRHEH